MEEVNHDTTLMTAQASVCAAIALALVGCAGAGETIRNRSGDWRALGAAGRSQRLAEEAGSDLRLIRVRDAVLRFVDAGRPTPGPGLLFVHGLDGGLGDFAPLFLQSRHSHRVVALDLPGSGGSVSMVGDYSVSGQARVLAAFMDAVGLPQAHLACHSLGGQVCLAFALAHRERVRSLTLVSPAGVYRAQQYVRSTIAQRARVNVGAVAIADPSRTLLALLTDGDGTLVHRFVTRNPAILSMLASFRENLRDRLREVRVPTLAIWGDADPILPMEDGFVLAATLPGAVLHVIEGAGHESQLTHPELVRTWMDEFQRSH